MAKKDNTLGMVTLFQPIMDQLNAGDWREKRLAEMIKEVQHVVTNVRGAVHFGSEDNATTRISNLHSAKLDLIKKLMEVM